MTLSYGSHSTIKYVKNLYFWERAVQFTSQILVKNTCIACSKILWSWPGSGVASHHAPPYKYAIVYERACRPSALINHRKPLKASIDSCTVGLWLTNKTIFLAVITDNLSTNLILSNAWALDRIKYYVRLNVTITFAIARSARISQTSAKLRVLFTICEFCGVSEPAKFFQLAYFAVVEIRLKTPGSGS